jgi:hypothetical protein
MDLMDLTISQVYKDNNIYRILFNKAKHIACLVKLFFQNKSYSIMMVANPIKQLNFAQLPYFLKE